MGIEDYNFLKSTLEEVSKLQEGKKETKNDLKGWKKSLNDRKEELAESQEELEGIEASLEAASKNVGENIETTSFFQKMETVLMRSERKIAKLEDKEIRIEERLISINFKFAIIGGFIIGIGLLMIGFGLSRGGEFSCGASGQSIPYMEVGDGEADCDNGRDESVPDEYLKQGQQYLRQSKTILGCTTIFWLVMFGFLLPSWYISKEKVRKRIEITETSREEEEVGLQDMHGEMSDFKELVSRKNLLSKAIEDAIQASIEVEKAIQIHNEEIRNIDELIETKMKSISHLIPYSEFLNGH